MLCLLVQDSFFPFGISSLLLKFSFKLLAMLALLIKLRLGILLLSLQALRLLLDLPLKLFTVHLDSVLIPLHSPLKLSIQIISLLLCKHDLLLVQCRLSFVINFLLS